MTIKIRVDEIVLLKASEALFSALGPLDDLGPELGNTVANVYYRFLLLSHDPGAALSVKRGGDAASQYRNNMAAMGEALAHFQGIEGMVKSLREVRATNADIGEYLVRHMLDTFKYRIPHADKKTPIRRAIERQFRRVDEIAGLYQMMCVLSAQQNDH